jgi:microcystin-dependent protein
MADPYTGEIRMMGNSFAPVGWALCAGQLLPIAEHEALYSLIGTTYGGDGQDTFGLPNLQGRVAQHLGAQDPIGSSGGAEAVTLTTQQLPQHNHVMLCSTAQATTNQVQGNIAATLLAAGDTSAYATTQPYRPINPNAIQPMGGSQPHDNRQPYQAINFIICLDGVYPPRN